MLHSTTDFKFNYNGSSGYCVYYININWRSVKYHIWDGKYSVDLQVQLLNGNTDVNFNCHMYIFKIWTAAREITNSFLQISIECLG